MSSEEEGAKMETEEQQEEEKKETESKEVSRLFHVSRCGLPCSTTFLVL